MLRVVLRFVLSYFPSFIGVVPVHALKRLQHRVDFPWQSGAENMVRYSRRAGMQAARSPKTWEKAIADQNDISWPFGMSREYSLLGLDAVNQRHPTNQYQEKRDEIPFL